VWHLPALQQQCADTVLSAPNGIRLPETYRDWQLDCLLTPGGEQHAACHPGYEISIQTVRDGNTLPWPNGAIPGRLAAQT